MMWQYKLALNYFIFTSVDPKANRFNIL